MQKIQLINTDDKIPGKTELIIHKGMRYHSQT